MDLEAVNAVKETVAQACRVLGRVGLVDWLGHVSARIPDRDAIVIKGHGFDVGDMKNTTKEHMILIDFAGNLLEGSLKIPFEWPIHTCIYQRRSDVQSVVHTHQLMATAFVTAGKPILPIWHPRLSAPVATPPPVFDDASLLLTTEQGDRLAMTLGSHQVCLLRGHGVITVGSSVEEASLTAIYLEKQAEMNYFTLQIGQPIPLRPNEMDLKPTPKANILGRWAYFTGLLKEDLK